MAVENSYRSTYVREPSQVRLITGADDPYIWEVLLEKKHLFSKSISDHSIGAYKELCEVICVTFEVVPVRATTTRTDSVDYIQEVLIAEVFNYPKFPASTNPPCQPSQVNLSARIDELQEENLRFERELKQWKGQATAESERRCALIRN